LQITTAGLWLKDNFKLYTIGLLIFLFPAFSSTIQHSSGLLFYLLVLGGIFFAAKSIAHLSKQEKIIFSGFLIFFLIMCLSLVNTADMDAGIRKIERYLHFPLAVFAYLFLRKYQIITINSFVFSLYFASVFLFSVAFYTTNILGQSRAALDHYPIIFGDAAILISVLLCAHAVVFHQSRWRLLLSFCMAVLGMYAALASGSRGAFIVLPFVLVLMWFLYRKQISWKKTLSAIGGIGVVLFLLNLVVTPSPYERTLKVFKEIEAVNESGSYRSSTGARLTMWQDAITIWKESPIIGTGMGDFAHDSKELIELGKANKRKLYGHAHNIFLDTMVAAGLLGLFCLLLAFFIYPFYFFYQQFNCRSGEAVFAPLAGLLVITCFFVFGLTEGWMARNVFVRMYAIYFLIAMVLVLLQNNGHKKFDHVKD